MSIQSFIEKVCVQTAVYWGTPVSDGFGKMTFAAAREIKVRWDEKNDLVISRDGKEMVSTATILVTEDLEHSGMILLAALTDLSEFIESSGGTPDPYLLGAFEIVSIKKVPMIKSTTDFVRTVYISAKTISGI